MTGQRGSTQLMSMPTIAEVARVERSSTSTWRRCHPGFPPSLRETRPTPVRRRADRYLAGKEDPRKIANAPEGVLMLVRTESIRFSALDTDPALIDNTADRQIFTVSTVSLIDYLRAGAFRWIQDGLMRTYGRLSILIPSPTAALCNGQASVYGGCQVQELRVVDVNLPRPHARAGRTSHSPSRSCGNPPVADRTMPIPTVGSTLKMARYPRLSTERTW